MDFEHPLIAYELGRHVANDHFRPHQHRHVITVIGHPYFELLPLFDENTRLTEDRFHPETHEFPGRDFHLLAFFHVDYQWPDLLAVIDIQRVRLTDFQRQRSDVV